jgi:hypothetical protein
VAHIAQFTSGSQPHYKPVAAADDETARQDYVERHWAKERKELQANHERSIAKRVAPDQRDLVKLRHDREQFMRDGADPATVARQSLLIEQCEAECECRQRVLPSPDTACAMLADFKATHSAIQVEALRLMATDKPLPKFAPLWAVRAMDLAG